MKCRTVRTYTLCQQVKLVSIDAVDIADGNSSIILGLIWNIILFFQVIAFFVLKLLHQNPLSLL